MVSINENPDFSASLALAHEFYFRGDLNQAIEALNEVIDKNWMTASEEGNRHPRAGGDPGIKNFHPIYAALGLLYFKKENFPLAEEAFIKALSIQPDDFNSMYNLALCYEKQSKLKDAVACLLAMIEADPFFAKPYFFLAKLLLKGKNNEKSEYYFNELSQRFPNDIGILSKIISILIDYDQYEIARKYSAQLLKAHQENHEFFYNAGVIEEKLKNIDQAILLYKKSLDILPDYFPALNNLGVLSLLKQEVGEAKSYFKKALEVEPNNESVEYTLSALTGVKSKVKAPEDYVAKLFDAYADHFDEHLQLSLDYCVPKLLYEACKPFLKKDLVVLDLGCGTGLTIQPFLSHAKRTVGVDLSEKMLIEAKKKNCYFELYKNSLIDFLSTVKEKFDLVLAGDVLVYTGNLEALFKCLFRKIKPEGLFSFSIEVNQKESFLLKPSGRFAHSKNYIKALAEEFQFEILVEKEAVTRSQFNEPVSGMIYVLKEVGHQV